MIKTSGLVKIYNGNVILNGIDFVLPRNKKIALVGANGCGKTTLFKIMVGEEEPTNGRVTLEGEKIGYIPQEFRFDPNQLVGEFLLNLFEEDWEFYKAEALLQKLEFNNYDEYQRIGTLSEGQKMKLKMIEQLLEEPTTLLIDEPTNHLDIEGIMWFEKYIKSLNISVVMISHDREFLNNTVDAVWEIEKGKVITFAGNYDTYKEEKLKLIGKWNAEYTRFLKQKAKLESLITNVGKIKGGAKRGKAIRAAKKRFDREITKDTKEEYIEERMQTVEFDTEIHAGKLVVDITKGQKKFGEIEVFNDIDLEIRGKDRVWIYGQNGTGKSTLVKIINTAFKGTNNQYTNIGGEKDPLELTEGTITVGPDLKVGYFAQKSSFLNYTSFLKDAVYENTNIDEIGKVYGLLTKFLFNKEDIEYKRVGDLSPGQRARFVFAIFSVNDYDVLILDEPTNHLDISTKEVIEESLNEYKGTLILVSHDRYFVESVNITKTFNLKRGTMLHV